LLETVTMNGGEERSGWNALLERFSLAAAQWSSGSGGFGFALALVLAWLVAGPFVNRRAAVAADGDDLPKQRRKRRGR
jgi:hypothetical protein